jgi:hypothetical protein
VNRDSLTASLPIYVPFISSSCLTSLARNSKTMLNRSGDSGHPCFIPHFRGNCFSFSPLSMMLPVGLSYISFIMLRYIPSIPNSLRAFIMKWSWIFSMAFSVSLTWASGFCFCFYWCAILHLMICECWIIPASLGWSWLGHGEWPFWYVVGLGLPLFYWGFLYQCSLRWLAKEVLLFEYVLVWFGDECNTGFIEWVRQHSFPFYFGEKFTEHWY